VTGQFDAGDVMDIHLWSSGPAPENSFTAEFRLFNDDDVGVSFGSANPVRDTYYRSEHQHFVCRLGPLPLTEGRYAFSFTRPGLEQGAVGLLGQGDWIHDRPLRPLFNTGHGISNVHDGDFVIQQEWLIGN
jgi:hypothetical protein